MIAPRFCFPLLVVITMTLFMVSTTNATPVDNGVETLANDVNKANQLVTAMAEEFAKDSNTCCNQTPCFIGCPVGGIPRFCC
ncbi:hypothetical protein BKA57DRAFT_236319 [Linnemannia elongata]|nr:hypothetical protein BKA57DRAFT_236319 [Linnemannia elongata]